MTDKDYRKLSRKEAFATIGLHPKDEATFFLANLIILVKENKLRITKVSGKVSSEPENTFETTEPFIFTHNGLDYLLKVENNTLSVYEKQSLIGN